MASYRDPAYRLELAVQENNLPLVVRLRYKTEIRNTDSKRLTSLAWAALSGSEDVFEWLLFDAGHEEEELSRDQDNSTILHLLATLPEGSPLYTSSTSSSYSSSTSSHYTPHPAPGSSTGPGTPSFNAYGTSSSGVRNGNGGVGMGKGGNKKKVELWAAAVRMTNMYLDVFPHLIDWSNAGGKTALHSAAQSGNVELVQTLCEMGADLDLTDLQGNTPKHYAAAWNNLPIIRLLLEFGSFGHQLRNNAFFLPSDYAYSTILQREIAAVVREVQEERKLRRKASELIQGGGGGSGAQSPVGSGYGSSYGVTGSGLRSRESRGTLMSDDGGRSYMGSYNVSPGGRDYGGFPGPTNGRNGNGAMSPASTHRTAGSPVPPAVQIQRTATAQRDRSGSHISTTAPGPPSTPQRMLASPSADRIRMEQPSSPLASPGGSILRPPARAASSVTGTPAGSPATAQGSFRDQQTQSPRPILRHAPSSETRRVESSPRLMGSPSRPSIVALGSPISRGTTPTPGIRHTDHSSPSTGHPHASDERVERDAGTVRTSRDRLGGPSLGRPL